MANKPKVEVIREYNTGRNERFRDTRTGNEMTRNQFVRAIDRGDYGNDYYHRKIMALILPSLNLTEILVTTSVNYRKGRIQLCTHPSQ